MPGGLLHDRGKEIIATSTCSRDHPGAIQRLFKYWAVIIQTELQKIVRLFLLELV